jgi:hypothetical protein
VSASVFTLRKVKLNLNLTIKINICGNFIKLRLAIAVPVAPLRFAASPLYLLEGLFYDTAADLSLKGQLLAFTIGQRKLGYLVVEMLTDKLVIRTFLFLTNDGTLEGRKLAALTRLRKLDKQHLGIDTLMGFRKLHIAADPVLTRLFAEAGCADLLDLADLDPLLQIEVTMKDTDFLLRYLENSPFMKQRGV